MFDTRWRKLLRDAWLHKSRSLLVVAAVTLGMIAAGALLDTWALVQRVTTEVYRASHPLSATLRIDTVDADLLARVRALPAIAAVRARRTVHASLGADGAQNAAEIYALDDFERSDIARLAPERGTWPPRDGGIVIERSALDFSGASLGASVLVQLGDAPPQTLPVTGTVRDVGMPPGWMDHVVYAFVTPATLARLGAPTTFDELQFVVRDTLADRAAVRRVAYEAKALAERNGHRVSAVDVPEPMQHPHAAQMNSLMLVQGAFALLTLLVCGLLIVNLIAALLAGQQREIAVMKALGARPAQIGAMYLGFALALGAVASLLALPAAIAIAHPYAALKADMLNFPIDGFAIPWWAIALQLGIGCVLPVVAAAIPVASACSQRVVVALRDTGIAADGHVRRRLALPGLPRPLLLSLGNAFRRRQRMLLTLLALAAGGAVFLGADNLSLAVRGSVDQLFASWRYDFIVRLREPRAAAEIERIAANVAGVESAEAWSGARATLARADDMQGETFTVLGVPADSAALTPTALSGRWLAASDRDAIVVSRALLKDEPALVPGSDAQLSIGGKRSTWHVVGVVDAGPQELVYVPRAALAALRGDDRAAALAVTSRARDAAGKLRLILELRAQLERAGVAVASSTSIDETRRTFEDHLLMVVQFLGAMGWVMIVVGGMGLAATMSLAVLERTREIGVLRAIGARHRAILQLVAAESVVIAVLAWLVSIPLSAPMSIALAEAFGRIMLPTPVRYLPSAGGIATWFALVVVVALLASLWPAWRATRIPTAAALSYE